MLRSEGSDSQKGGDYSFERLKAVVQELVETRQQLQLENANLREQVHQQGRRAQNLDERLLEANQRRQDALKRVDGLIARLDQIDSDFEVASPIGLVSAMKQTSPS